MAGSEANGFDTGQSGPLVERYTLVSLRQADF